jgi:hypothetical protein
MVDIVRGQSALKKSRNVAFPANLRIFVPFLTGMLAELMVSGVDIESHIVLL